MKCIDRVDLTLHGSFADLLVISNSYKADHNNGTSLFVLTSPGQLHFYEYASLSMLKSERGKNHSVHASEYNSIIPTVEPCMTVGKLYMMGSEGNILGVLSKVPDIIIDLHALLLVLLLFSVFSILMISIFIRQLPLQSSFLIICLLVGVQSGL